MLLPAKLGDTGIKRHDPLHREPERPEAIGHHDGCVGSSE